MKTNADNQREASSAVIRRAQCDDALVVAGLLAALGYPSSVAQIERRIALSAASADTSVILAASAQGVIGLLFFHCIPLFHTDGRLSRITSPVVAPAYRQRGIGRSLVAAAEEFAWAQGCIRVEVTSGDHRPDTHTFYAHLGYQLDGRRFIKHGRNAE